MKIAVIYYSLFGNLYRLAQSVLKGAESLHGSEVILRQVSELLPNNVIQANARMMDGKQLQKDIPLASISDLEDIDGLIIGSPTRFGNMSSQMKNFIDETSPLWLSGKLIGKPVGFFTSSSSMHGGQESTLLSMMIPFLHHGMLIVGVPYSVPELLTTERGGSPYGASAVVGPNADQPPTHTDLKIATELGKRVAEIASKLTK